MKLTETQRRFKEQMREIQDKPNIYDNNRDGNPFIVAEQKQKRINSKVSSFIMITIAIILFMAMNYLVSNQNDSESTSKLQGLKATPVLNLTEGAVPRADAMLIKQLNIKPEIQQMLIDITRYHQQPIDKVDINHYRKTLMDGKIICDEWLEELQTIKPYGDFGSLYNNTLEYVFNLRMALSYYYEYTLLRNTDDLNKANEYLKLYESKSKQFRQGLIQTFKDNNYKYEILSNGDIQYWYSQS